jgi:hypothetical protein
MITKSTYYSTREDGIKLYERHSDIGMMCREVGTEPLYSEMIEPEGHFRQYEETDIPIEREVDTEQAQKAAAFDYLTGRTDG